MARHRWHDIDGITQMARHRWHFFFWHNTNTYSCKRHFFFWHNTDAYSCKQRSVQMCTDVYRCLRIPLRHMLKLYATGMVELRYKQCSSMGNVQVWATFRYGQRSGMGNVQRSTVALFQALQVLITIICGLRPCSPCTSSLSSTTQTANPHWPAPVGRLHTKQPRSDGHVWVPCTHACRCQRAGLGL